MTDRNCDLRGESGTHDLSRAEKTVVSIGSASGFPDDRFFFRPFRIASILSTPKRTRA